MTTTQEHATGSICIDCTMLEANGDWPEWMDADELAQYRESIDNHPNAGTETTLGHLHDETGSQCWHTGTECDDDCDCEHTEFSSHSCDMCGTTLAGYRHDVTFWFDA